MCLEKIRAQWAQLILNSQTNWSSRNAIGYEKKTTKTLPIQHIPIFAINETHFEIIYYFDILSIIMFALNCQMTKFINFQHTIKYCNEIDAKMFLFSLPN